MYLEVPFVFKCRFSTVHMFSTIDFQQTRDLYKKCTKSISSGPFIVYQYKSRLSKNSYPNLFLYIGIQKSNCLKYIDVSNKYNDNFYIILNNVNIISLLL